MLHHPESIGRLELHGMKLIRSVNQAEKPGLLLMMEPRRRSRFGSDYDEAFFGNAKLDTALVARSERLPLCRACRLQSVGDPRSFGRADRLYR